jgi:hypothetical protein
LGTEKNARDINIGSTIRVFTAEFLVSAHSVEMSLRE